MHAQIGDMQAFITKLHNDKHHYTPRLHTIGSAARSSDSPFWI